MEVTCDFNGIPYEILVQIFSYLSDRELRTTSCACKIFNKAANEGSLWEVLCNRDFKTVKTVMRETGVDWKVSYYLTRSYIREVCKEVVLTYHQYQSYLNQDDKDLYLGQLRWKDPLESWTLKEASVIRNEQKQKYEKILQILQSIVGSEVPSKMTHFVFSCMLGDTLYDRSIEEIKLLREIDHHDISNYFLTNSTNSIVRYKHEEKIYVIARINDEKDDIAYFGVSLPDEHHIKNTQDYKLISGSTTRPFKETDEGLFSSERLTLFPHITTYLRVRALFDDNFNPQGHLPEIKFHTLYQQS